MKRAAVSTDGMRPWKAARTGSSGDPLHSEDILVPLRIAVEEDKAEVKYLSRARDFKEGVILPLVWVNSDVMAYENLGAKYLDTTRFGTQPRHGRASKILYAERSRATVYGAWRLRQEDWRIAKEHTRDEMDTPVVCDEAEAVYVKILARLGRGVEPSWFPKGWLGYCMLSWPHYALPFLDGPQV